MIENIFATQRVSTGNLFIRPHAVIAAATLCVVSLVAESRSCTAAPGDSSDAPLNIVMILADDQCWRDFGFMDNQRVSTPNLDALAARSAIYTNGYVPMSVCRPSLATLLTGLYPHQHGIHFNHPPPGLAEMRKMTASGYRQTRANAEKLIERVPSLPRILAKNGYACLQTGKHWEGSFQNAGFTSGMTLGRPAAELGQVTGTRRQENGEWVAHGNGDAGLRIGRETMRPIRQFLNHHAGKRPVFIWYAPFLPHTPFDAASRYRDVYRNADLPDHLLAYYAEIARFDETVGALLEELDRKVARRETLIVFASDNGFRPRAQHPSRYTERSKLSAYDDGLRTPVLISWEGKTRPRTYHHPVSTIDLVPTILGAAGLEHEITPAMQGRDLMPSASGNEELARRPVFGAIYPNDAERLGDPARHVRARWVRFGDYKLIVPGPAKPRVQRSLFKVDSDPLEKNNLINDRDQAERIATLMKRLDAWWLPGQDRPR